MNRAYDVQPFDWDIPLFIGHRIDRDRSEVANSLSLHKADRHRVHPLQRQWFRLDRLHFPGQIALLGATGSGKSTSIISLLFQVALQWLGVPIYITAKDSPQERAEFCEAMALLGRRVRLFPSEPYDLWRGSPLEIVNRLIAMQDFSDAYYRSWAEGKWRRAIGDQPPRNSVQALARLRQVCNPKSKEDQGLMARYEGLFASLGGSLDGNYAIEDVIKNGEAGYFALDSTGQPQTATHQGNGLLLDFLAGFKRADIDRPVLICFDEFGAAPSESALALVERGRSFGANFLICAQSYEGLGLTDDFRARIWEGSNTHIIHRLADPSIPINIGGTQLVPERSEQFRQGVGGEELLGSGSLRWQHQYRIPPNLIRELETGEAVFARRAKATLVKVASWRKSVPEWWWNGMYWCEPIDAPPAPPLFCRPDHPDHLALWDMRERWERHW